MLELITIATAPPTYKRVSFVRVAKAPASTFFR